MAIQGDRPHTIDLQAICVRVRVCSHGASYQELSRLTKMNPETIRRHMVTARPSLEFVYTLCESLDVNANWLLFGLGPIYKRDLTANVVSSFGPEAARPLAGAAGRALAEAHHEHAPETKQATSLKLLRNAQAP